MWLSNIQLWFAAAFAHKDVCMDVDVTATRRIVPCRAAVAPIHDGLCRKSEADRRAGRGLGFDVNEIALVLDKAFLKQTGNIYDVLHRFDTFAEPSDK